MINKGEILFFILYVIFYILFAVVFDTNNIFGYFLHILLFLIPVYLLYKSSNKDKNSNFYIILSLLAVVIIYFLQYNYLKIPEYSENFLVKQINIKNKKIKNCYQLNCSNENKIEYINYTLNENLNFWNFSHVSSLILDENNKEVLKNIKFNKKEIFELYLSNFVFYETWANEKTWRDLFFHDKEYQEYKKSYVHNIYDKIINNKNINLEIYIPNNDCTKFKTYLMNKQNQYSCMLFSEKVFQNVWNNLENIEEKLINI